MNQLEFELVNKEIDIKKLVQGVVAAGPGLPLDRPEFDLVKPHKELLEHLEDNPAGAGLYYTFLHHIVKNVKPKLIVELGNRKGSSTLSLITAMGETQTLYTVDIRKDLGLVSADILQRKNVHALFGSSIDPEVVDQIPNNIDFLFIDTLHKYSHLCEEWELYKEKLSDGAIVACDDINWEGMGKFIGDIKHFEYVNESKLHGSGFLVFRFDKERDK